MHAHHAGMDQTEAALQAEVSDVVIKHTEEPALFDFAGHAPSQEVCANCAPCHAGAQLVQNGFVRFSESRSVLSSPIALPIYRSALVAGLDRPPR